MADQPQDPQAEKKVPAIEDLPPAEEELAPCDAESVQGGTLSKTVVSYPPKTAYVQQQVDQKVRFGL